MRLFSYPISVETSLKHSSSFEKLSLPKSKSESFWFFCFKVDSTFLIESEDRLVLPEMLRTARLGTLESIAINSFITWSYIFIELRESVCKFFKVGSFLKIKARESG